MKNKLNDTKFCIQLWNGTVIDSSGAGGICCEIPKTLAGTHIKDNTLFDFQNNELVCRMRSDMAFGLEPPECINCFSKERHGVLSLRQHLNDSYELRNPDHNFLFPINVENLELRFGDLCQLQCIMCHPSRSKKIKNMVNFVKTEDPALTSRLNYFLSYNPNFDSSWVEDDDVYDKILSECGELKRLFVNGGEPLLAKTHNTLLSKLIESGISKNIELIYSTNFLLMNEEHLKIWSKFKHVTISLSLDDLYDRNKFIRWPSEWESIVSKLDFIKENHLTYPSIHFNGVWRTINSLNFMYTIEFLEFFRINYPFLPITMRSIQDPTVLNPKHMPFSVKKLIGDSIIDYCNANPETAKKHIEDIRYIIDSPSNDLLFKDSLTYYKYAGVKHDLNERIIFKEFFDLLYEKVLDASHTLFSPGAK